MSIPTYVVSDHVVSVHIVSDNVDFAYVDSSPEFLQNPYGRTRLYCLQLRELGAVHLFLKMVATFEKASSKRIPIKLYKKTRRRNSLGASTERDRKELGWKRDGFLLSLGAHRHVILFTYICLTIVYW